MADDDDTNGEARRDARHWIIKTGVFIAILFGVAAYMAAWG